MLASATKLIPSFLILTATHTSSTFGIILLVESLFLGPMLKDSVKTLIPFDYLPSSHVMTSQILFVLIPSKFTISIMGLTCAQRLLTGSASPYQIASGSAFGSIIGLIYKFIF